MAHKVITGSDLYKGYKMNPKSILGVKMGDLLPFQFLKIEDKTIDWIKAIADYYETVGWTNVEKRAHSIQRNYWMRNGKLNFLDYVDNPSANEYYKATRWVNPPESNSPLKQFYHLAPMFVDLLRGEFLKRDNTFTVEVLDEDSKVEAFKFKEEQFKSILAEYAMMEKQAALAKMGLGEDNPEEFEAQMQQFQQRLVDVELAAKSYRTTGQQWAQKVLDVQHKRYNLSEIEPDAFECGLITDREFWHLDLMDDDFKTELLNPKWCDYHKGPGVKYVSQGDYFLWFDFMSAGDIVNRYGRRMTEEDIEKMRDTHVKTINMIVPDIDKGKQDAYYDYSKSWSEATALDPGMNDALLGMEMAYSFMRSPNFDHNMNTDMLDPMWGRFINGEPQMFRVMRLYWRSLRRIGWLTKVNRDGTVDQPDWVDENYKVTIEPEYDTSVVKKKTKDNLVYGEHIEWTWVPEWRHIIKISPNQKHTFWLNNQNTIESIYIDGDPVRFQFKGRNNPFDSLPPVEGCHFSYLNTTSQSFIDRVKPFQIIYNIAMNKVPKKVLKDYGNKVAVHKGMYPVRNLSNNAESLDPAEEFENRLSENDVIEYATDREAMHGIGQPPLPQILQLSTVDEAHAYLTLAQLIKAEAGELIGITRQRLGQAKASDTATAINQGVVYSEAQTEKYYDQHTNLMERVRQRMLDAAQYYSTFNESSREVYLNDHEQNVWLDMEGMNNLLPHYSISITSRANARSKINMISQFLREENTLDILPSKKIGAMVEQNFPKLMQLLREGELEAIQREKEQRQHEQRIAQEAQQKALELEQLKQAFQRERDDKMIKKDIDVATIKALGQIQTDADADSQLDAAENLDDFFRQQEISDSRQAKRDEISSKRQTDIDKMTVEREKAAMKLEGDKYKADKTLEVAEENRTAAELKKKQAAKKKKK